MEWWHGTEPHRYRHRALWTSTHENQYRARVYNYQLPTAWMLGFIIPSNISSILADQPIRRLRQAHLEHLSGEAAWGKSVSTCGWAGTYMSIAILVTKGGTRLTITGKSWGKKDPAWNPWWQFSLLHGIDNDSFSVEKPNRDACHSYS